LTPNKYKRKPERNPVIRHDHQGVGFHPDNDPSGIIFEEGRRWWPLAGKRSVGESLDSLDRQRAVWFYSDAERRWYFARYMDDDEYHSRCIPRKPEELQRVKERNEAMTWRRVDDDHDSKRIRSDGGSHPVSGAGTPRHEDATPSSDRNQQAGYSTDPRPLARQPQPQVIDDVEVNTSLLWYYGRNPERDDPDRINTQYLLRNHLTKDPERYVAKDDDRYDGVRWDHLRIPRRDNSDHEDESTWCSIGDTYGEEYQLVFAEQSHRVRIICQPEQPVRRMVNF
jgi:hypothetical protein